MTGRWKVFFMVFYSVVLLKFKFVLLERFERLNVGDTFQRCHVSGMAVSEV